MAPCHYTLIKDCIMEERQCRFVFHQVERAEVERTLLSLSDDKSPGTDNLDTKLFRVTANQISTPISHIFNKCLMWCAQKSGKSQRLFHYLSIKKSAFPGPNSYKRVACVK